MKTAVVIRHLAFEDLGSLAGTLASGGYEVIYLEAGVHDLRVLDPLAPDLLIVLGGPIGVYEDASYPFIRDELALLRRRLAADRPTLGICLGAQLMAAALGARVYPGGRKEIGWKPVSLTAQGSAGPLAALCDVPVLHWHGDTFDLPVGATRLGSSDLYENQAFAVGRTGLALQFHAEVTVRGMERWFIGHTGEISATPGLAVNQLRADTAVHGPTLERAGSECFRTWLEGLTVS